MVVNCAVCDKLFQTSQNRLNNGRGKYCSIECRSKNRKNPPIEKICKHCGKIFSHTKKKVSFCSRLCARHNRIPDSLERFWGYVVKSQNLDTCWIWVGYLDNAGYGLFSIKKNKKWNSIRAHRFSYELEHGQITNNLNVLHKCDNPPCVNPNHLFLGTHQDNIKDKMKKNRQAKGEINGRAILTDDMVRDIRIRVNKNRETHKSVSELYNISPSNVYCVAHRLTWRHVR